MSKDLLLPPPPELAFLRPADPKVSGSEWLRAWRRSLSATTRGLPEGQALVTTTQS